MVARGALMAGPGLRRPSRAHSRPAHAMAEPDLEQPPRHRARPFPRHAALLRRRPGHPRFPQTSRLVYRERAMADERRTQRRAAKSMLCRLASPREVEAALTAHWRGEFPIKRAALVLLAARQGIAAEVLCRGLNSASPTVQPSRTITALRDGEIPLRELVIAHGRGAHIGCRQMRECARTFGFFRSKPLSQNWPPYIFQRAGGRGRAHESRRSLRHDALAIDQQRG